MKVDPDSVASLVARLLKGVYAQLQLTNVTLAERWCALWVHRQSSMRALAWRARRDAARFKGEPFDEPPLRHDGCSNEP